jgi:hypothetical protein
VNRRAIIVLLIAAASTFPPLSSAGSPAADEIQAPQELYWCPMHPDVRAATPGLCPVCRMALVRIPVPRTREYRMEVRVSAGKGGRGLGGLDLWIRDPDSLRPVSDFVPMHERLLHLFIVSRSLEYFAHVHPEYKGNGRFSVNSPAPADEYMVIADFLPADGTAQLLQRAIVTPGYSGSSFAAVRPLLPDIPDGAAESTWKPGRPRWSPAEKTVEGIRVRLEASELLAGRRALLRFTVFDARGSEPVTDLEPFLGAPGHLLIVTSALTDAVHGHPEETDVSTSVVTFRPVLPAPGLCKLWVQFQRRGAVITVPFVVQVSDS